MRRRLARVQKVALGRNDRDLRLRDTSQAPGRYWSSVGQLNYEIVRAGRSGPMCSGIFTGHASVHAPQSFGGRETIFGTFVGVFVIGAIEPVVVSPVLDEPFARG